jgi:hypothetical protein
MTAIPPLGKGNILPVTPHTGAPPSNSGAFSGLLDGNGALKNPIVRQKTSIGATQPPVQTPKTLETGQAIIAPPAFKDPAPTPALPAMPGLVVPPKAEPLPLVPVTDTPEGTQVFDASGPRPLRDGGSTFRFEDLGMFGKYAAEAETAPHGPATPIVQLPRQPATGEPTRPAADRDIKLMMTGAEPMAILGRPLGHGGVVAPHREIRAQQTTSASGALSSTGGDTVVSAHAVVAAPAVLTADPAVTAPLDDEVPVSGVEESGGETPLASAGAGKAPPRTASPAASNPLNVTVAGEGEALSVAMRGETDANYSRMRQMVEDAAGEFGLDVGEFRLNGSGTELTFGTMLGGNRGRSS